MDLARPSAHRASGLQWVEAAQGILLDRTLVGVNPSGLNDVDGVALADLYGRTSLLCAHGQERYQKARDSLEKEMTPAQIAEALD